MKLRSAWALVGVHLLLGCGVRPDDKPVADKPGLDVPAPVVESSAEPLSRDVDSLVEPAMLEMAKEILRVHARRLDELAAAQRDLEAIRNARTYSHWLKSFREVSFDG